MAADDKTPVPRSESGVPEAHSSETEVAEFLKSMKALGNKGPASDRGRLIFAMDATMSRQPTWDMALKLQADMFKEVQAIGGLDVQLIYFRSYDECRASPWVSDPQALARLMTGIRCLGGFTQIRKVLVHARRESERRKVDALVYVGDCMEEEIDHLAALAGELSLLGVPAFMFQEGRDRKAETAFKEIARLTKGAYCRFDAGSAQQLRELLRAVAAYAAGGRQALEDLSKQGPQARLLLEQLKR